ncbi:MAG: putative metal-binding motif-containing protein [Myxococcota bacterium]
MWAFLLACSSTVPLDRDRDGFLDDVDCDDADAFVHPGALEVCDARDNDCDGAIDDADADVVPLRWWPDPDGDGYAASDATGAIDVCVPPDDRAWARLLGDCAPDDPSVRPQQPDGCDGADSDCDGLIDEDPDRLRYVDADGDGWGGEERLTCDNEGTVAQSGDCNDDDAQIAPDATEVCNDRDDDCDGLVDDADPDAALPTWWPDEDEDGVGVEGPVTLTTCVPPNPYWAVTPGDCNDFDATVFPGALERCDARDSDCDGFGPANTAWADPDQPFRVTLTVVSSVLTGPNPVAFVDVDFRSVLDDLGESGPFDPGTLTAWTQDCAQGARSVDVSFTDGFARILEAADPRDPVGDAFGAVHLRFGEPLLASVPVEVGLYFGGPSATSLTPSVSPTSLGTSHLELSLDPDRGGLLDDFRVGGTNVLSWADAFEGNGARSGGEWLRLAAPGAVSRIIADAGGVGVIESVGAAGNPFAVETWWWTYGEVPVAFAKLRYSPNASVMADEAGDVRPVQSVAPGLSNPTATVEDGWVSVADGAQWGFMVEPSAGITFTCDGVSCWAVGSEAGGTTLSSGDPWLDHRVVFVVADDGSGADRVSNLLVPPAVSIGPAGLRPGR